MKVRGVGANSVLAFGGDAASKAAALLVVILAARLLSVDEFAAFATAFACAGLLMTALDLGAGTLLTRDGASGAASRGALLRGLLEARAPLAVALLLGAALVGVWLGDPWLALAAAGFAIAGALALSVLGVYRSCQDLKPEALQRLAGATLAVVATLLCGLVAPRADVLLAALALAMLLTLMPLIVRLPAVADLSDAVGRRSALRSAAPIGLIALATVAYYRSGTIALAALGNRPGDRRLQCRGHTRIRIADDSECDHDGSASALGCRAGSRGAHRSNATRPPLDAFDHRGACSSGCRPRPVGHPGCRSAVLGRALSVRTALRRASGHRGERSDRNGAARNRPAPRSRPPGELLPAHQPRYAARARAAFRVHGCRTCDRDL